MAEVMSILIIGAAELGTAVIDALAAHPKRDGAYLSVSMRPSSIQDPPPSKRSQLKHLQDIGVQPVALDVEVNTAPQLAEIFAKYHAVIGCTGMAGSPGLQMKLAQAVLEAKTPRYIPWQFGVDYDIIGPEAADGHFASQCEVRDRLRSQQDTRWVIISTGIFMSFLFEPLFRIVDTVDGVKTVRAFGDWSNQVTATTVEDIGRCTAEVMFHSPAAWESGRGNGHVVHIAGDTLTFEALAAVLSEVTGSSVRKDIWTSESLNEAVRREPDNGIHRYRMIWAENKGVAWDVAESFNGRRGIPMTTIRDWAQDHFEA